MTYAIIDGITVVNIADATRPIEPTWIQVPTGMRVGIGDTFNGELFFDSEGNVRFTPEQEQANKIITEQAAKIQFLQENNEMLTDCILEMSSILYA